MWTAIYDTACHNDAGLINKMKAERLLSALLLLQAHGKLTGRALAERRAVSGRTVHRDMEALSVAGVPAFASRGSWRSRE